MGLALGSRGYSVTQEWINGVEGGDKKVAAATQLPFLGLKGRFSPFENLSFGIDYWPIQSFGADIKYLIINKKQFALSFGAGYLRGSLDLPEDEDGVSAGYLLNEIYFPLYLTYDLSRKFSLHASPTFRYQDYEFSQTSATSQSSASFTAYMLGTNIGLNYRWFFLELGAFSSTLSPGFFTYHATIGFSPAWDNVLRPKKKMRLPQKSRKRVRPSPRK